MVYLLVDTMSNILCLSRRSFVNTICGIKEKGLFFSCVGVTQCDMSRLFGNKPN